ncbi:MAG: glycoside hydrolase family 5 protein [Porcipelethomonas sp.]
MKKVSNFICIAAAMVLSFTATACNSRDSAEKGKMRTDMTSAEYAQEMGIGLNLGNTFEAYWEDKNNKTAGCAEIGENTPLNYETCWGAIETTKEAVDGVKKSGFNTLRIPVYWGNMMADDGTCTINEEWFKRIDEVVGYSLENDLYTVINVHHFDEFIIKNYEKSEAIEIAGNIWTQIAEHYKDYSDYLIFEGYNESLGSQRETDSFTEDELYSYVNEMNQTFVDAVRKTGGNNKNRMLIISGYWTNIDLTTGPEFLIPEDETDDRIMVSVHYIDNSIFWSNQIGNDRWIEYSKEQCELLKSAFTDKGIQVFVGECTAKYEAERLAPNSKYQASDECLSIIMNMAADYGFIPVIWDVNDGMYSRTENKIKLESDQAVITEIAEKIKNR